MYWFSCSCCAGILQYAKCDVEFPRWLPWPAPLILIGLAFFVVGLLAGLLSSLPSLFRLRMENGRLKRELRVARDVPVVPMEPPMPPLI